MSASITRSLVSSECLICSQRLARLGSPVGPWAAQGQVRGKKKLVKAKDSIPAKLLLDLPSYGRKGSYVPVGRSQMRNYLFPRRICDYVTAAQVQDLKKRNIPIERDSNFGRELSDGGDAQKLPKAAEQKTKAVDIDFMAPAAAFKVLDRFVPPVVEFYRTPIANAETVKTADKESATASSLETESVSHQKGQTQAGTNIYGSVGITDVATAIKAALSIHDPHGRILLADEDIKFIRAETGEDAADRVKQLGDYTIEIKLKGHDESIQRIVRVLAERQTV